MVTVREKPVQRQCPVSKNRIMNREGVPLLFKNVNSGLSLFFATLCIIDIFGVFPIVALPHAIVQCGLYGIPLVLVVFIFQVYTATLLGKSWMIATSIDPQISQKNRYPLAAVTELTLGSRSRIVVALLLDLTIFCSGIPNLLVASQNLQLFGIKASGERFDLSFCYWLLVVGVFLCPMMWLGSPRDMKWLSASSCIIVISTTALIWWCIIADDRMIDNLSVPVSPTWDKFISGYGMLAFQFDVHPTLMTVQVDMRYPREIYKAVIISVLFSGSLFGITTTLAVWRYGGGITANLLQALPSGSIVQTAVLLTAMQLCLSSALGSSALFQHLEDQLHVERSFGWKRCAMRSAVVFLGVAVGESVPRFDIVMALIGGTLIGPLVFVLPSLIYAKALALSSTNRASTPDIYSTRRRDLFEEDTTNTRIHSRSTYYGFPSLLQDRHRYSYIYYNDDELDDIEERSNENTDSNDENVKEFPMQKHDDEIHPILLDPSETRDSSRDKSDIIEAEKTLRGLQNTCDSYKFMNWFDYFVVLAGVAITISSTYINIRNTVRYVRFTPPCIVNASVPQNPS